MSAVAATKSTASEPFARGTFSAWVLGLVIVLAFIGPYLSFKSQASTGEGSVVRQASYILAFIAAVIATRSYVYPGRLMVVPVSIMITLIWCVLSLGWAIAPGIGLRRLILTATIIWTVFITVENAGYERSVSIIAKVLIGTLVVNYLFVALLPSYGVHLTNESGDLNIAGDWRGVLSHKNYAGPVCAYTILIFVFARPQMRPLWRVAILLAATFFLYKTMSKTSLALVVLSLALGGLFRHYKPRYAALVAPIFVFVAALALFLSWSAFPDVMDALRRPDALTGRGQIWPVLINYAKDHPLGAGYGSFWNVGQDSPLFDYARGWVSDIAQGHNGYLDTLVTVGAPGLLFVVMSMLLIPIAKLMTGRRLPPDRAGLLFAAMIFCLGHNFTESSIFDRDAVVELLLLVTVAMVYAAKREAARQAPEGRALKGRGRQAAPAAS